MTKTNEQIKYMVNRFLGWRLPENFNPDGGISFTKTFNESTPWPMKYEPTGTNLLDATQAEEMVRYMVEGMPAEPSSAVPESQNYASSMPHVNCTGPCCRPDLWKAAIKGSVTSEAQTVPIPERWKHVYQQVVDFIDKPGEPSTAPIHWTKSLIEDLARAEATIAEIKELLRKRADDEYCTYVSAMKRPECLGWKQKVKDGTFGETELTGHTAAAIHLGRHQAFADAARATGTES